MAIGTAVACAEQSGSGSTNMCGVLAGRNRTGTASVVTVATGTTGRLEAVSVRVTLLTVAVRVGQTT